MLVCRAGHWHTLYVIFQVIVGVFLIFHILFFVELISFSYI